MRRFASTTISAIAILTAALALAPAAGAAVLPIPGDWVGLTTPAFEGSSATPQRVASTLPPKHPFMAANGSSNIHGDAWQTDSYAVAGPLGRGTSVNSTLRLQECASVTFDSRGRLITVCVGLDAPYLVMMDANTLAPIATYQLPPRQQSGGDLFGAFTDFSGGGYFYLDNLGRAVVPTSTRHIQVLGLRSAYFPAWGFKVVRDYDLTSVVSDGDPIVSAMPDWAGRIWFVSKSGVIGTVIPSSGVVQAINTGEPIHNSFAVDETGGVYVTTDAATYRLDANPLTGAPQVTWREAYDNIGVKKPGQTQAGSGTTPTVMRGGLVAIADNADPMKIVVMRRDATVSGSRTVCTEPVFGAGAGSTDQSLIAAGDSLIVENNYGYDGLLATTLGKTTTPGLQKVKVDASAGDCATEWTSGEISPSAVAKVSLATGLVYTYTKPARDDILDAWYFTAINACTGQTVFRRLAGTGPLYNNNFAPISLAPDGDAYVGVIGGLVRIADASRPTSAPQAPSAC